MALEFLKQAQFLDPKWAERKLKEQQFVKYPDNVHELINITRKMMEKKGLLSSFSKNIEKEDQLGVVYELPCPNCDTKYIGETKQKLKQRFFNKQRLFNINLTSHVNQHQQH